MSARETAAPGGQIPFRIRIGVTGHRDLRTGKQLEEVVRTQVRRIVELLPSSHAEIRLAVVSQLAEGADRLVVQQVLTSAAERGHDAHLEVVLPLESDRYAVAQGFPQASREEFERLLEMATVQSEPTDAEVADLEDSAAAYEAAGREIVGRCDVLVALWNGRVSRGRGGTAEILAYAAARSKPCIWISTEGEPSVRDNLAERSAQAFHSEVERRTAISGASSRNPETYAKGTLTALREAFSMLDEYDRARLPADFAFRLEQELGSQTGVADWVAGPFTRATLLAARWQRLFRWFAWAITLFATAAAAALAMSLSYGEGSTLWPWAEAGVLVCALVGLVVVRISGFHRRWLSYRVLAERLRSAHYLAPTGADFRRQAQLEAVYVGDRSEDWLMRAFEEVWDRRPKDMATPDTRDELIDLKRWLADEWIGSQILYHEAAARHHRRWHLVLTTIVASLFVATVVFAVLHANHVAEDASTFLSITLPAAGASLGVLLTINQHHALSERHARMRSDLAVARRAVLAANTKTLDKASSEAARVVAQETGAWFGTMWFLDIEHP